MRLEAEAALVTGATAGVETGVAHRFADGGAPAAITGVRAGEGPAFGLEATRYTSRRHREPRP